MSIFQKRHYEKIAEVLRTAGQNRDSIVSGLSHMFCEDNPKFNPPRFFEASTRNFSGCPNFRRRN